MKNKHKITISLCKEVWERVQTQAELRNMSTSALMQTMIKADLIRLEDERLDTLYNNKLLTM